MDIVQLAKAASGVRRLKSEPNLLSYMFLAGEDLVTVEVKANTYIMPFIATEEVRVNTTFSASARVGEGVLLYHTERKDDVLLVASILEKEAEAHEKSVAQRVARYVESSQP